MGVFLALLLASARPAHADATGRIEGVVKDETGGPLPGVTVEVQSVGGGRERSLTTDAAGAFEARNLAPGRYRLDFRLPSFATAVRTVDVEPAAMARNEGTVRIAMNADLLLNGRRTFPSLTDLDEPVDGPLGPANAGSEGVVTAEQIEQRPLSRAPEVFEAVPGVVVSQHSGEGKASQYYVRGFNIDHGTDLATWVAGVPTNMPTHAHGQ